MPLKVLIVDDSNFFQTRLKKILGENPQFQVVGVAANGREAVEKAQSLKPDLITMDYEMPVMDGVSAVRQIMANKPVPILMFSSMTYEGAKITLDALEAGAVDFMTKNFAEVSNNSERFKTKFFNRLLAVGKKSSPRSVKLAADTKPINTTTADSSTRRTEVTRTNRQSDGFSSSRPASVAFSPSQSSSLSSSSTQSNNRYSADHDSFRPATSSAATGSGRLRGKIKLLVIGASTGGPVALAEVLSALPANFPVPIVLVQHMPENFTKPFAERLNRMSKISVKEAVDGDPLRAGSALLAPGGKQLMVDKRGTVKVLVADDRVNYKPCLDITFGSAAKSFGKQAMGLVLTGMGADGRDGAKLLKQAGGTLWSQDEASSVIYGMPMAVAKAGLSDRVVSLSDISDLLSKEL